MHDDIDTLMGSRELAEYLGISTAAAEKWRQTGRGPAYIRVGRLVRYRRADVECWLRDQTVPSDAA